MAIQPKELIAKKKENAKTFLDELEKQIDKQLTSKTYNESLMVVDISHTSYQMLEDKAIFEALEQRYHGWLVRKAVSGASCKNEEYYQLTFVDKKKIPSATTHTEEYENWDRYR